MTVMDDIIGVLTDLKTQLEDLIETHPALAPLAEGNASEGSGFDDFYESEQGQEVIVAMITMAWQIIMHSDKEMQELLNSDDY